MARKYHEVLEDVVKNQVIELAKLVTENDQLREINSQLAGKLNGTDNLNSPNNHTDSNTTTSNSAKDEAINKTS